MSFAQIVTIERKQGLHLPAFISAAVLTCSICLAAQLPPWRIEHGSVGDVPVLTAEVAATAPHDRAFRLTLRCRPDLREFFITSSAPMAWKPYKSDPSFVYVDLRAALDTGVMRPVGLRHEAGNSGRLVPGSLLNAEFSPQIPQAVRDEILRTQLLRDPFQRLPMPTRALRFEGLAPGAAVEFAFDTLSGEQQRLVYAACYEADEKRVAAAARLAECRKQARGEASRALEAEQDRARREWCETTRGARRLQLVERFLSGVRGARNGGERLANALREHLSLDSDAVRVLEVGATQTCPDVHFAIDLDRLRPTFARIIGAGATDAVVSRRIAALLDEGGMTLKTTDFAYEVPMPQIGSAQQAEAMKAAEASCGARLKAPGLQ
jgi:hypothetical protein